MIKTIAQKLAVRFPSNISNKNLIILASIGLLVRMLIWAFSIGTNDIIYWESHAKLVATKGLIGAYKTPGIFNHPPLPALYAEWIWSLSNYQVPLFAKLIKIPSLVGDVLIFWLLNKHYSLRLAAIFSILPASILVTSFHGNTDSLYAAFLLASLIHKTKKNHFLSGLFFAFSLNIKLVPLVVLFPFFILCKSKKSFSMFILGGVLGMIPFYYPALMAPFDMYRNMLKYNSNPDNWGVQFFFNKLRESTDFDGIADSLSSFYSSIGRYLILFGNILIALESRFISNRNIREVIALCGVWFFLTTPGFGVQYVVFVLPIMLIHNEDWGVFWGLWSGLFIGSVYFIFMRSWMPMDSYFGSYFPKYTKLLGLIPWIFCAKIIYHYIKDIKKDFQNYSTGGIR